MKGLVGNICLPDTSMSLLEQLLSKHWEYKFWNKINVIGLLENVTWDKEIKYSGVIIIIVISGSTVHVRTLAASHRRFRNLIKKLGSTLLDEWSARRKGLYQHSTTQKHKGKHPCLEWDSNPWSCNQATKIYTLNCATTRTGTLVSYKIQKLRTRHTYPPFCVKPAVDWGSCFLY
jgi:hypothetical protein